MARRRNLYYELQELLHSLVLFFDRSGPGLYPHVAFLAMHQHAHAIMTNAFYQQAADLEAVRHQQAYALACQLYYMLQGVLADAEDCGIHVELRDAFTRRRQQAMIILTGLKETTVS